MIWRTLTWTRFVVIMGLTLALHLSTAGGAATHWRYVLDQGSDGFARAPEDLPDYGFTGEGVDTPDLAELPGEGPPRVFYNEVSGLLHVDTQGAYLTAMVIPTMEEPSALLFPAGSGPGRPPSGISFYYVVFAPGVREEQIGRSIQLWDDRGGWDPFSGRNGVFDVAQLPVGLGAENFSFGEGRLVGWSAAPGAAEGADYGGTTTVEIIPEPTTLSLLALGGVAMFRRRRRR